MVTNMKKLKGFTLVELLVVIAIIGILSSIVMVSLGGAKQKARDSKRMADIKSIQLALATYYNDNLFYPKNIYTSSFANPGVSDPANGLAPAYLPVMPKDPNSAANYTYNAFTTSASSVCNTTNIPVLYHLGAAFDDNTNTALASDVDANQTLSNVYTSTTYYACSGTSSFHGNALNCAGTSPTTDNCYDVTP